MRIRIQQQYPQFRIRNGKNGLIMREFPVAVPADGPSTL